MKKSISALAAAFALSALAAGVGNASPATTAAMPAGNIVQTTIAAKQFTTLVSLLRQAGLVSALEGPGKLTVFAPTNAAFAAVPKATLAALAKNPAELKAVLLYHVVKGAIDAAAVEKVMSVTTLEGQALPIEVSHGKVFVGGAQVITPNVMASNGIIHVINKVLIPPAK